MVIVNCMTRHWKYRIKLFFILLVLKILLLPIINIGYIYGMRNMQDSAITYQRKSVKYAMRSKDRSMILTSWHNLSHLLWTFENVDSAVVYAYKVLQHLSYGNEIFSRYYYNIGDLYVGLGTI